MDPGRRLVSEVMRAEFVSVHPKERLETVDELLKMGRFRHMPVLIDGHVVGVLSQRDLLAACVSDPGEGRPAFFRAVHVEEVMNDPITVAADASLGEAAASMLRHNIGCLPVVDTDGNACGLVTETDLLRIAYDSV